MRTIDVSEVTPYQERWDLLDYDADEAQWMIPEWVWNAAKRYPPPGVTLGKFLGR